MAEPEAGTGGSSSAAVGDGASPGSSGYGRSAVRSRIHDAKTQAGEKGAELKETATRKAEELKETAGRKAEELKETAGRKAEETAGRMGERAVVIARALRRAGEELRGEGETRIAGFTYDAASQVERFGSYLDGKSSGEMVGDLEGMARRNPALFVGGTFALGVLAGRFLRAGAPDTAGSAAGQPTVGQPSANGDHPWSTGFDGGSAGEEEPASPAAIIAELDRVDVDSVDLRPSKEDA